jgi:hypothetical protein
MNRALGEPPKKATLKSILVFWLIVIVGASGLAYLLVKWGSR